MRRVLAFMLAMTLVFMFVSMNIYAKTEIQDVYAKYFPGSTAGQSMSFDLEWGSMLYEFHDEIQGTWNPQTHTYDGAVPAKWVASSVGADRVIVTNHSNVPLNVECLFIPAPDINVIGTFDESSFILPSATNSEYSAAPSRTVKLTLSGSFKPSDFPEDALTDELPAYIVGTANIKIGQ